MRFRKLRIAWSVFCGLAAVLLIVLWSYSSHHTFAALVTPAHRYYLHSIAGTVAIERQQQMFSGTESQLLYEEAEFDHVETYTGLTIYSTGGTVYVVSVSYWLLVAAAILAGAI